MNLAETETVFTTGLGRRCSEQQRAPALRLIRQNRRIPPELALRIYGNNVSGALVKALIAAFPACRQILGEPCFNGIAHRFIEHAQSDQADLNRYGATFSGFLDDWTVTQAPFSDYRYLGDLARLEWLCHRAYYAADDAPFDFTALAEAGADAQQTLRFQLGHSVGLLQSAYPVMEIHDINLSNSDAAQVPVGDLPEYLLVSRLEFRARIERLDAITFQVLAACRDGVTLSHMVDTGGHRTNTVAEILPGLIQRRWITGFTVNSTCTTRDPVDA
ncbi:MAG: DNA-binding domain-containing protein [Pseudomonadota bacterium]|nr:DNA-binding domain-containing protein [Pseudomonadota bacterium]